MIFQPAARYPADPRAVFVLALSVFSGLTSLAVEAAPDTLEAVLPHWAVIFWGVCLCLGSAVTLGGMARQTINGIVTEQVGSVMVGVAALFYSAVAFKFVGADGLLSLGIIAGWGVACLIRWLQLQILINSAHRRQLKQELLAKVYAEIQARHDREAQRRRDYPGRPKR